VILSDESYVFSDENANRKECENSSYLQLFKYNISEYKEEKIENFHILEHINTIDVKN